MNEFKGTPGPWGFSEWDDGLMPFSIETGKGIAIAYICSDYPQTRTEANANLIAAAPDLLTVCQLMESVYRQNVVQPVEPSTVLDALQAAIKKALGDE